MSRARSTPVALRPVTPEDDELLFRVYASTREEELARLDDGWDAAGKEAFLRMQFLAQRAHYEALFPEGESRIILRDGAPAGRFYVDRRGDDIRLVDIALLPEHRGAGIGEELLRGLLAEARAAGRPVVLHVEVDSRAGRLYERLGFVEVARDAVRRRMRWAPGDLG